MQLKEIQEINKFHPESLRDLIYPVWLVDYPDIRTSKQIDPVTSFENNRHRKIVLQNQIAFSRAVHP